MTKLKKSMLAILIVFFALLGTIFIADYYVQSAVQEKLYHEIANIPKNKVGLLLGTVKILPNGNLNRYYKYRIIAAATLFKAGKIDYLLVSGDNSKRGYDEPTDMKNDLIKQGVPANKIFLDYAGFRTLDSVVRSKDIFGQTKLTIVSQKFHNERAIFIAQHKGIEAIGFEAQDVSIRAGFKIQIREKLARVKVLLDLLFGVQPKFGGKKINIPS